MAGTTSRMASKATGVTSTDRVLKRGEVRRRRTTRRPSATKSPRRASAGGSVMSRYSTTGYRPQFSDTNSRLWFPIQNEPFLGRPQPYGVWSVRPPRRAVEVVWRGWLEKFKPQITCVENPRKSPHLAYPARQAHLPPRGDPQLSELRGQSVVVHSVFCTTGICSARSRSRSSEPTCSDSGDCTHL